MAPEPAARPTAPAAPFSTARRLTPALDFDDLLMIISPYVSRRLFGRRDGYRMACLQRACLRLVPGRDHAIADSVAGGVELAVGELGRDVGAAVGGNRDADISSLVFDFADRA